jgi:cytochrome c
MSWSDVFAGCQRIPLRMRSVSQVSGVACVLLSSSAIAQESFDRRADATGGQQVFNNACRLCHTTRQGDNRQGPNLYNIIGRKAGSLPNYPYSSALKGADFVWDEKTLERFIANPDDVLASARSRADVVSFLQSLKNTE